METAYVFQWDANMLQKDRHLSKQSRTHTDSNACALTRVAAAALSWADASASCSASTCLPSFSCNLSGMQVEGMSAVYQSAVLPPSAYPPSGAHVGGMQMGGVSAVAETKGQGEEAFNRPNQTSV
eukprot:637568-Pelagomonas_calceolata.AAC.4